MKTCRRAIFATVVLAFGAGIVPRFAVAQTPECKKTIAALEAGQAWLVYADELPPPDRPNDPIQRKDIDRVFACRGVRQVTFLTPDGKEDRTLAALPALLKLEEPEQITLILQSFAASRFDDLAKQAEVLNKLKGVQLGADMERPASDTDLAPLAKVENLELLAISSIQRTGITDAGLLHLANLKRLKSLILNNSQISDDGLAALKDLSELEYVSAMLTDLTGEGLRHLEKAPLKRLMLTESKVTDEGLRTVGRFEELSLLFLGGCPIDGSGLRHLSNLKKLERLSLTGTDVDDASLAALIELPMLRELALIGCPVTDAGIDSLTKMRSLRELSIRDTNISQAGREELQKALPDTKID